jgi:hypothetical protein
VRSFPCAKPWLDLIDGVVTDLEWHHVDAARCGGLCCSPVLCSLSMQAAAQTPKPRLRQSMRSRGVLQQWAGLGIWTVLQCVAQCLRTSLLFVNSHPQRTVMMNKEMFGELTECADFMLCSE